MTTGATAQLGLALPVQGELSGTWGDTVNNGITQYTNIAIAGTLTLTNDGAVTLANTTGDASASNITASLTGAGTVTAQFAIVRVTGTLTTAKVVTGPSYSKTYTVVNAATGGIVTFKASGQTGVSIAVGETAFVYFNGTDYVKVVGTATAGAAGGSNTQVQFNSSGVLAGSSNMTFDGTTLTANALTVTNAVTLSGGTANGVAYLNGSKVVTSGSALVFDGSNLGIGTSSPSNKLVLAESGATSVYQQFLNNSSGNIAYIGLTSGGTYALQTNNLITFSTGASYTERMRLDSSGNLGLGVTPSAWNTDYRVYQLAGGGALFNNGGSTFLALSQNNFVNSSSENKYIATAAATRYRQSAGTHIWDIAPSGTAGNTITFTQAMTLTAAGDLGLGTTTPQSDANYGGLTVNGTSGSIITLRAGGSNSGRIYTTTVDNINIDANGSASGTIIFRTGTGSTERARIASDGTFTFSNNTVFNGNVNTLNNTSELQWKDSSGTAQNVLFMFNDNNVMLSSPVAGSSILFRGVGYAERARIDASGNLGLGVTPAAWGSDTDAIQMGGSTFSAVAAAARLLNLTNCYWDGTNFRFLGNGTAQQFRISAGTSQFEWHLGATGTTGNIVSFTQAMTLDASGNLGIGTSSPLQRLDVVSSSTTVSQTIRSTSTSSTNVALRIQDGTTGTSNTDGIYLGRTGTENFLWTYENEPWIFATNNTERMRLDSSGNLGIGTTSPSKKLDVVTSNNSGTETQLSLRNTSNGTNVSAGIAFGFNTVAADPDVLASIYGLVTDRNTRNGALTFSTAASATLTERGRIDAVGNLQMGVAGTNNGRLDINTGSGTYIIDAINSAGGRYFAVDKSAPTNSFTFDSSGNLLVGTTTAGAKLTVEQASANANGAAITNQTYNYQTLGLHNTATANDNVWVTFGTEASFTTRGSITYNRAGGLTAYNTTSDYRAKDIIGPVTDSGALIDSVPVYMGKMKGATQERPMFIAHETPAYAHTGVKDAVDADGNPVYQQMDASALIPVMWAEIQSLRKRLADAGIA